MQSAPRSFKPVFIMCLLVGMIGALAYVFQVRDNTIVRAPGIMYPRNYVRLQAPTGRVEKVFKKDGDDVKAGDKIFVFDTDELEILQKQAAKDCEGFQKEVDDRNPSRREALETGSRPRGGTHGGSAG